jgi:hypothetical protein
MLESGLVTTWRNKQFPDANICELDKGFQERALNNSDLMSTYLVTGVGLGAGLVGFALERLYKHCRKRREEKKLGHAGNKEVASKGTGTDFVARKVVQVDGKQASSAGGGSVKSSLSLMTPGGGYAGVAKAATPIASRLDFPHQMWMTRSPQGGRDSTEWRFT